MMPPQIGATGHQSFFALVSVPLLCPHSPKQTLTRLNATAQLSVQNSRAGRHCLHILGIDHSVLQPTCPELLVAVMLLPRVCWTLPLMGTLASPLQWDVGQEMSLLPWHCGFTGALLGTS